MTDNMEMMDMFGKLIGEQGQLLERLGMDEQDIAGIFIEYSIMLSDRLTKELSNLAGGVKDGK